MFFQANNSTMATSKKEKKKRHGYGGIAVYATEFMNNIAIPGWYLLFSEVHHTRLLCLCGCSLASSPGGLDKVEY